MSAAPPRPKSPPSASELARALDEEATCARVRDLERDLFEIQFSAPQLAARARPGEFAQILVAEELVPLLRRPYSFSRADPQGGTVSFYLAAIGQGSRRLRRFLPGQIARILGPLGRGFTLPERPGRSLLVAGGLGAAPFPLLMERLLAAGEEVMWLNGARSAGGLYPADLLPPGLMLAQAVTEDGSAGLRGMVTDALAPLVRGVERVYACGPNPLLAAVAGILSNSPDPVELEVSIEAPMGCGFGTCLGCAIPLASIDGEGPPGLCCRQGPVLRGEELDWERLLRQSAHLQ